MTITVVWNSWSLNLLRQTSLMYRSTFYSSLNPFENVFVFVCLFSYPSFRAALAPGQSVSLFIEQYIQQSTNMQKPW